MPLEGATGSQTRAVHKAQAAAQQREPVQQRTSGPVQFVHIGGTKPWEGIQQIADRVRPQTGPTGIDPKYARPANSVYAEIVRQSKLQDVPAAIALSVAQHESGLNQAARSPAGAIGIMQLMPATAEGLHVDPTNWRENIRGGVRDLRIQYDHFKNWKLALAAYNAGGGAVEKYGGIPPYAETQAYVRNVISTAKEISSGKLKLGGGDKAVLTISAPLPGAPTYTSDFGPRAAPTAGAGDFHAGVDMSAPAGTPIHAMVGGKVTFAGWSDGGGNTVEIQDKSGRVWTYHHMITDPIVSAGDRVDAGNQIGNVGSTGISTGNHLHIGVKVNGEYVNPMSFIQRAFGAGWNKTAQTTVATTDFNAPSSGGASAYGDGGGGSSASAPVSVPEINTMAGRQAPDIQAAVTPGVEPLHNPQRTWQDILNSGVASPETKALAERAGVPAGPFDQAPVLAAQYDPSRGGGF